MDKRTSGRKVPQPAFWEGEDVKWGVYNICSLNQIYGKIPTIYGIKRKGKSSYGPRVMVC
jgi:hypothetical protein